MLYNGKTSYRIVKSNSDSEATILVPDTQVDTEEYDITANTIIHNETADSLSTRETTTNTTTDRHKVDDIITFIKIKFNYLTKIM